MWIVAGIVGGLGFMVLAPVLVVGTWFVVSWKGFWVSRLLGKEPT
jgi:hypothetical protein